MLDTLLGNNDGAPIRVPSYGSIVNQEVSLTGTSVPNSWEVIFQIT
jgi:hypothetical protein